MSVKNVTLYSLPYVVGVAGILAVAQQAAPPITSLGVSGRQYVVLFSGLPLVEFSIALT